MVVCICKGIADREIDGAIRDGAETVEDLARVCSAGTDCGECLDVLDELLSRRAGDPVSRPRPLEG